MQIKLVDLNFKDQDLIEEYITEYTDKIFYFCLKKTGNSYEAEDLAADISLNIITALKNGAEPNIVHAWVWSIARNRYSLWADKKHKKLRFIDSNDITELEICDDSVDLEKRLIYEEELSTLRRELSFITNDYRTILVDYYINTQSVSSIAKKLSLPCGTIKSKLYRARQHLREGMSMAREFGSRSYNPEEINFMSTGSQPSGLPWNIIQRKIPKNILIAASNNPSTLEELSMELGIAMPYMEEEVKILHEGTLLKKIGDKFITDFFIADKECLINIYDRISNSIGEISKIISEIITDNMQEYRNLKIASESMSDMHIKWWLAVRIFDYFKGRVNGNNGSWPEKRSNGEDWGIIGYEDVKLPKSTTVGCNGMCNEKYNFWTYKYKDYDMWDQVGEIFDMSIVNLLGDSIENNRNIKSFTASEQAIWRHIDGKYAHSDENGYVIADILSITKKQMSELNKSFKNHSRTKELQDIMQNVFDDIVVILKKYSHECLNRLLYFCASMEISKGRMLLVHELLNSKFLELPIDTKKSTYGMMIKIEE